MLSVERFRHMAHAPVVISMISLHLMHMEYETAEINITYRLMGPRHNTDQ